MISVRLNNRHRTTLESIYQDPIRADLRWSDIEAFLVAIGADIEQVAGSRVRVRLGQLRAVFHRPHPRPETDKGAVKAVRRFLEDAGVRPWSR